MWTKIHSNSLFNPYDPHDVTIMLWKNLAWRASAIIGILEEGQGNGYYLPRLHKALGRWLESLFPLKNKWGMYNPCAMIGKVLAPGRMLFPCSRSYFRPPWPVGQVILQKILCYEKKTKITVLIIIIIMDYLKKWYGVYARKQFITSRGKKI